MLSYKGIGSRWPYTNTSSALLSGAVVTLLSGGTQGTINIGVAVDDIAATTGTGVLQVCGRVSLTKTSGEAYAVGDKLYWTGTAITSTASGSTYAGQCVVPAASGDTTVDLLLNSTPFPA